ncbi:MAG TPA: T9SS type A sorting domain-containing protein [Ignavibacteria bacterium]|nr:T9SS type A sorting domain-containing protein [Ignavibacteria bacterium]
MKKLFILLIVLIFSQPAFTQTFQWVKNNSINISSNPDFINYPSTIDASGNFIVGSIHVYRQGYISSYFGDVIFRKYNASGSQIFQKIMTGKVLIKGIDTDNDGNIYLFGSFMDTLIIEPGNVLLNTGSGFNLNYYLIKFNSGGVFVWKKNINTLYGNQASIDAFKVKSTSIYAFVLFSSFQSMIKKFDLNGNEQSSFTINPVRQASAIDLDASGNIYVAGSGGLGNIQFSNVNVNCPYNYSLYFAKFNTSTQTQWVRFVEDVTFESPRLVSDAAGNAYVCGNLSGAFLFGNIQTEGPQWIYDFYLAKLDPTGIFQWVKEVPQQGSITGDAANGFSNCIDLDNQGNVYMTGFQRGSINWGNLTTVSSGIRDVLALKFSSAGNLVWGKTAGGINDDRGDAVSVDAIGNIFISGNFSTTAMFDTISVNGSGYVNMYAAKLSNPPLSVVHEINIIPEKYSLTNYPNPFNPSTNIRFAIIQNNNLNISIFDAAGKEVEMLFNSYLKRGTYEIKWNPGNVTSGIYFCRILSGNYTKTIKMLLIK